MAVTSATTSTAAAATATTTAGPKKISEDYANYLKLLTTQLQNQDPTAPSDTNALTQQIASLSQVEQQLNTNNKLDALLTATKAISGENSLNQQISTNKNLEKLIGLINGTSINTAVSYIGKDVETQGNQGMLAGGKAKFVYGLEKEAASVELKISNPRTGEVVYSGSGTTFNGRNEVYWDGINGTHGGQEGDGVYTIAVTAKDANNQPIKTTTYTAGTVTAVDTNQSTGVLKLLIGDISVDLDKILSVRAGL